MAKTLSPWQQFSERVISLSFPIDPIVNLTTLERTRIRITGQSHFEFENADTSNRLMAAARLYCHKNEPLCSLCPIRAFCVFGRQNYSGAIKSLSSIPFIDLFCGAGGLSYGLGVHGMLPMLAVDYDRAACDTYAFNHPEVDEKHIRSESVTEILHDSIIPEVPLVVGGPPCQGFSNANRQRLTDDSRNYLYKAFIQAVSQSKARVCLLENVVGMLKSTHAVHNDFAAIGFTVRPFVLDTQQFGYPQNRKRVFWLGVKSEDLFQFNKIQTLFEIVLKSRIRQEEQYVLGDAILDLPSLEAKTIKNATDLENEIWGHTIASLRTYSSKFSLLINGGKISTFLFNHRTKFNNERDIEIYRRLRPGEGSKASSIEDIMPYKNRNNIFHDKFYKLDPLKPSKTITAHMYYDCHMYIHPYQARGLTPREAARIQGFPDDYFFLGRPNEWYRQIGNAVSPLLSKRLGHALAAIFQEFSRELL